MPPSSGCDQYPSNLEVMKTSLDWFGCATFRLTIGDLVVFLDAYIDRVDGAAVATISLVRVCQLLAARPIAR